MFKVADHVYMFLTALILLSCNDTKNEKSIDPQDGLAAFNTDSMAMHISVLASD